MPAQRASKFLSTRKTLVMATMGNDGIPTISYAPFVRIDSAFYIYTSGLSRHTHDLLQTERASIMFIEDEAKARNLFARRRLTFPCRSTIIPLRGDMRKGIMELFESKFGEVFTVIRPLGDFVLFQLDPMEGTYIEGFGQAYRIDAALLQVAHIGAPKP
jgi:putative heme iron utilization protein